MLTQTPCVATIVMCALKKKHRYTLITGEQKLSCGDLGHPLSDNTPAMIYRLRLCCSLLRWSSHHQRLKMLNEAH